MGESGDFTKGTLEIRIFFFVPLRQQVANLGLSITTLEATVDQGSRLTKTKVEVLKASPRAGSLVSSLECIVGDQHQRKKDTEM